MTADRARTRSSLARRLRAAAAEFDTDSVALRRLVQCHEGAATGSLLVLLSVPSLLPIPGTGTVLGLGLLAIAVSLWRAHDTPALPDRVVALELSARWTQRVLRILASAYELAARVSRRRLACMQATPMRRLIAIAVAAMALVLMLPIPFGNLPPAAALSLIGMGLVFRDGIAIALGLVTALLTLTGLGLLLTLAGDWALQGLAALGA